MTDIVERLREFPEFVEMINNNYEVYGLDRSIESEAADTIDTLRQRVAELEADNGLTIAYMSGFHDGKKAAQQHGDPVLYQCTKCGGANYGCMCESLTGCTEPLYAAPQTCFSAGDMADAQAKAAQVEREECAKVLDDVGARLQTDNEPDEFWRGVGATVEACEIAIRMRGKETK